MTINHAFIHSRVLLRSRNPILSRPYPFIYNNFHPHLSLICICLHVSVKVDPNIVSAEILKTCMAVGLFFCIFIKNLILALFAIVYSLCLKRPSRSGGGARLYFDAGSGWRDLGLELGPDLDSHKRPFGGGHICL